MLLDVFENDFKKALKEGQSIKVSVIRMLKADITNTALKLNKDTLDDVDILKVVHRHIKQRRDSIEQFKKGNREDLVRQEEKELSILEAYYPKQLEDKELEAMIKSAIEETGASGMKDMGKVIKCVLEKAQGKADGKRVSQLLQRLLGAQGAQGK